LGGLRSDGGSPALQISRQHIALAALKLKPTLTVVQDGRLNGNRAVLTPKPAFSSLDRVSLVPTADFARYEDNSETASAVPN
jgi:hypothetical protein